MTRSSAYVLASGIDYQYHFCGVISVQYAYSSLVASGSDQAIGTDFLNGVRNQPAQVTLTVAESDAMRQDGWSARMIACLEGIKMGRYLCTLVTPLKTFDNMVLTDFTAVQDEYSQAGWSGPLTFTTTSLFGWGRAKDNSSVIVNTASAGAVQTVSNEVPSTVVSSGAPSSGGGGGGGSSAAVLSPLQQMALRAGVRL